MLPLLGSSNGYLYLRTGPANWVQVYSAPTNVDPDDPIFSLLTVPNGSTNLVALRDAAFGLFSTNGGVTWTDSNVAAYSGTLQTLCCMDETGRVYGANDLQLMRSTDRGQT